MEITFIEDGSPDCPLIQIVNTTEDDIRKLITVWQNLSEDENTAIDLGIMCGIGKHIHLICKCGKSDIGIRQTSQKYFECIHTRATWSQVQELTEPFLKDIHGWQWLSNSGQISLLWQGHRVIGKIKFLGHHTSLFVN